GGYRIQLREISQPLEGFEQHQQAELILVGAGHFPCESHLFTRRSIQRVETLPARRALELRVGSTFNRSHKELSSSRPKWFIIWPKTIVYGHLIGRDRKCQKC